MTAAMRAWEKLPEKTKAEVIDNKLYVSPSSNIPHMRAQGQLYKALSSHVDLHGLGEVFFGGDIFLEDNSQVVVPDIFYVSKRKKLMVEFRGVFGAPDLIIEVLSPGNIKHDLIRKKNLYERNGVREYWIVDPDTKKAQGFLLKGGRYHKPLILNSEVNIHILNKSILF